MYIKGFFSQRKEDGGKKEERRKRRRMKRGRKDGSQFPDRRQEEIPPRCPVYKLHQALAPSSGAQLPPYRNSSPNSWSADLVLNNLIYLCFSTLFILVP